MRPSLLGLAGLTAPAIMPLVVMFFKYLPQMIEEYSRLQETSDRIAAAAKAEYLQNKEEVFDYIVVGAGSAGAVVANRLSQNANNSVLVLEYGGDPNPFTLVPSLFYYANSPSTDFAYEIVKQKDGCLNPDAEKRGCAFSRGKGFGGSSNVNAMNHVRGSPKDFDLWADMAQDRDWSYANVLKFFQKSEDYQGHARFNREVHSTGGELYVGKGFTDQNLDLFFRATREMRMDNVDLSSDFREGYTYLDKNIKNGRRWGTFQGFIRNVMSRKNLHLYRYARAVKVSFTDALRATGVHYVRHGIPRYVRARKEIILSAGSIDSPRLLMLSGIGPKEQLQSIGIKPLVDLPVGKGLEDQLVLFVSATLKKPMAFIPERDLTLTGVANYILRGTGAPAATFFNPRAAAFISSTETNDTRWPDVELFCGGGYNEMGKDAYKDYFNCGAILKRPKSNGELWLRSRDPNDRPNIDPKFLSHPSDVARLLDGVYRILDVFKTKPFRALGAELLPNHQIPGCEHTTFKSREYWECYIRHEVVTLCQPSGTARMGSPKSGFSSPVVVDSKLRVLGTTGLRVVDSSVMPQSPSGHLNAPTVMIGEVGSYFILNNQL